MRWSRFTREQITCALRRHKAGATAGRQTRKRISHLTKNVSGPNSFNTRMRTTMKQLLGLLFTGCVAFASTAYAEVQVIGLDIPGLFEKGGGGDYGKLVSDLDEVASRIKAMRPVNGTSSCWAGVSS